MSTEELIIFGIMFALSLVFSMLALNREKAESVPYKLMAAMMWFIFAFVGFIVGDIDALKLPMTSLWTGLGLMFTVWSVSTFFDMKKEKIWSFED